MTTQLCVLLLGLASLASMFMPVAVRAECDRSAVAGGGPVDGWRRPNGDVWAIERSALRLSPADGNGFRDRFEVAVAPWGVRSGPNGAAHGTKDLEYDGRRKPAKTGTPETRRNAPFRLEISTQDCKSVVSIPFAGDVATASWDGRDRRGRLVDPGLFRIVFQHGSEPIRAWTVAVLEADDPCSDPRNRTARIPLQSATDTRGEVSLRLGDDRSGRMCISAIRTGAGPIPLEFDLNGLNEKFDLGADTTRFEFGHETGDGEGKVLRIKTGGDRLHIEGFFIPNPVNVRPPPFIDPHPDVPCGGKLVAPPHPLKPNHPRRVIPKVGVNVVCGAVFEIDTTIRDYVYIEGRGFVEIFDTRRVLRAITSPTKTGPGGFFKTQIPVGHLVAAAQPLVAVWAACDDQLRCGTTRSDSTDSDLTALSLQISVMDIVTLNGFEATLVTNTTIDSSSLSSETVNLSGLSGFPALENNELATVGSSADAVREPLNDLPVIIHEAFDPLSEDSTEYTAWLLSGQPTDLRMVDKKGELTGEIASAAELCTELVKGPCKGFRDACGPHLCLPGRGTPSVGCLSDNLLGPLLDQGFDVWIVNANARWPSQVPTVVELAAGAPDLYQRILDYPSPDATRKGVVSGLSSGAVVARIALRLWEERSFVEAPLGLGGFAGNLVSIAVSPELEASPTRIAGYFSLDGVHYGARIPLALQAYTRDPEIPSPSGEILRSQMLLTSTGAQQLLRNYLGEAQTSCFKTANFGLAKKDAVQDCEVRVGSVTTDSTANVIRTHPDDREEHERYLADAIDRLGRPGLADEGPSNPFPHSIPSFAISNGSVLFGTPARSDELVSFKIKIESGVESTHSLFDRARQLRGSGLAQVCRVGLVASDETTSAFAAEFVRCSNIIGADVNSILAKTACGAVGLITGLFTGPFDNEPDDQHEFEVEIDVSAEVQMKPAPRFPTFVPTSSSLGIDPRVFNEDEWTSRDVPPAWRDMIWQDFDQPHFKITEGQCRFLSFHLSDLLKGDGDGWPACPADPRDLASNVCGEGGMSPGRRLDPLQQFFDQPERFCDCDDTDPTVFPGAASSGRDCLLRQPSIVP